MLNIPIIITAYNREKCLRRLLSSLNRAVYQKEVKLIISIDGDGSKEVTNLAESYCWKHGEKEVIILEKKYGLREHILKCGSLAKQYDGIILLEDDLYVAHNFYEYVQEVQKKYIDIEEITGVALYSHMYNETACLPFIPLKDGYDVFFMRLACSWGQSWLTHQWVEFEKWYCSNKKRKLNKDLPPDILLWPETSWKKYYIKYMIENNKYFVYPRESLTTNFGDPGAHHTGTRLFQTSLLYGKRIYSFPRFKESYTKYDEYCEINPHTLKKFNKGLQDYDFEVDLYGMKNKGNLKHNYVLTSQKSNECIKSYGREIKPHEVNIFDEIPGQELYLCTTNSISEYQSFLSHRRSIYIDRKNIQEYYYSIRQFHYEEDSKRILDKKKSNNILTNIIRNIKCKLKELIMKRIK